MITDQEKSKIDIVDAANDKNRYPVSLQGGNLFAVKVEDYNIDFGPLAATEPRDASKQRGEW